ncbi:hypothetical protein RA2_04064 [Roseovarius sp. A-2]|uniref:primase-helicase family protein n=1 Tax=Roseovarius sp. A-2 TaxID=1570360 RepID=UPI0009B52C82|nr:primase-helicase family protein [Roseovarius sp. A-2]GAW36989.1 hypothetical protein RA2_04064 [Roseovarius sp. A-2]
MKKKLPALSRRPSALQKTAIAGIRKKGEGVSGETVKRVIEEGDASGDDDGEDDPDIRAARDLLASLSSFEPEHVWWVLANRDQEEAQAAELGIDDDDGDDLVAAMKMLRKRYVYAARRDEVWDRHARDWISTRALSFAQSHAMPLDDKGNPFDAMKLLARDARAQRVHNERYMPGVHEEIAHDEGVEWLNTWRPSDLKPAKGDPKPMLDHVLYLCDGRKDLARSLTDWLAYCYQNPGKKVVWAPLIISAVHGVGKDTLRIAMKRLFGSYNLATIDDGAVATGRNEFMKRAQFVCVPEIMCGDRKDTANKLKPLITQEEVYVDEKNVKPYWIPNVTNFLFFSNHENAAFIEDEDRRYFVIICRAQRRSDAEYQALYEYINGPDIAGFAHFLANRDLSQFNPAGNAPETEDKGVVQKATRGGWEAWLDDAWQSDAAPFDRRVVNLRDALTAIGEAKGPRMTTQQIAEFLKKKSGGDLGRVRLSGGARVRLWATRDFDKYDADRAMAAEAYESPTKHLHRHLRAVAAE